MPDPCTMKLTDSRALACLQDTRPHLQVSPAELVMSPVSVPAPGLCMHALIPWTFWSIGGHACLLMHYWQACDVDARVEELSKP